MSLEKEDDDYLSARNAGLLYMTDKKSLSKQLEEYKKYGSVR